MMESQQMPKMTANSNGNNGALRQRNRDVRKLEADATTTTVATAAATAATTTEATEASGVESVSAAVTTSTTVVVDGATEEAGATTVETTDASGVATVSAAETTATPTPAPTAAAAVTTTTAASAGSSGGTLGGNPDTWGPPEDYEENAISYTKAPAAGGSEDSPAPSPAVADSAEGSTQPTSVDNGGADAGDTASPTVTAEPTVADGSEVTTTTATTTTTIASASPTATPTVEATEAVVAGASAGAGGAEIDTIPTPGPTQTPSIATGASQEAASGSGSPTGDIPDAGTPSPTQTQAPTTPYPSGNPTAAYTPGGITQTYIATTTTTVEPPPDHETEQHTPTPASNTCSKAKSCVQCLADVTYTLQDCVWNADQTCSETCSMQNPSACFTLADVQSIDDVVQRVCMVGDDAYEQPPPDESDPNAVDHYTEVAPTIEGQKTKTDFHTCREQSLQTDCAQCVSAGCVWRPLESDGTKLCQSLCVEHDAACFAFNYYLLEKDDSLPEVSDICQDASSLGDGSQAVTTAATTAVAGETVTTTNSIDATDSGVTETTSATTDAVDGTTTDATTEAAATTTTTIVVATGPTSTEDTCSQLSGSCGDCIREPACVWNADNQCQSNCTMFQASACFQRTPAGNVEVQHIGSICSIVGTPDEQVHPDPGNDYLKASSVVFPPADEAACEAKVNATDTEMHSCESCIELGCVFHMLTDSCSRHCTTSEKDCWSFNYYAFQPDYLRQQAENHGLTDDMMTAQDICFTAAVSEKDELEDKLDLPTSAPGTNSITCDASPTCGRCLTEACVWNTETETCGITCKSDDTKCLDSLSNKVEDCPELGPTPAPTPMPDCDNATECVGCLQMTGCEWSTREKSCSIDCPTIGGCHLLGPDDTAEDLCASDTNSAGNPVAAPTTSPMPVVVSKKTAPPASHEAAAITKAPTASTECDDNVIVCTYEEYPLAVIGILAILPVICLLYCIRRRAQANQGDQRGEYRAVAARYGGQGFDNTFSDDYSADGSMEFGAADVEESWAKSGKRVLEMGEMGRNNSDELSMDELNG